MVKRADHGREESDLDRIQDLFPSDHLRLHERDPLSPVNLNLFSNELLLLLFIYKTGFELKNF